MPTPLTEKLIQRQINHWNRIREFLPDPEPGHSPPPGPILTISRQAGSGGRILAKSLALKLQIPMHGQSLVEEIARNSKLEKEIISRLDERATSQARLWVQGVLNRRIFLRDQYHVALVKTVTCLAASGSAVFLGRGAGLILGSAATLRLRLVGSLSARLEKIQGITGLTRAEARALVLETDRQRATFIRKVFREEPGQPENYDLVINTDHLDLEAQQEMVLFALLAKQAGKSMTSEPAEKARG